MGIWKVYCQITDRDYLKERGVKMYSYEELSADQLGVPDNLDRQYEDKCNHNVSDKECWGCERIKEDCKECYKINEGV